MTTYSGSPTSGGGWKAIATIIVRHLVNDLSSTSYTDAVIETGLIVATQLLIIEDIFEDYTVDVTNETVTPSPASDNTFINLVSMKYACMILEAEVKTAASSAILVKDGPSTIDCTGAYKAKKALYDSCQANFNHELLLYKLYGATGYAVSTPVTVSNIEPDVFN